MYASVVYRGSHVACLDTWYILRSVCQHFSTEQCCFAVSDRKFSVLSLRTEVPDVDVCPGHSCDLNNMNHVWTRMGSDPIQPQEWVISPFLFVRPNI